jgi:hypothetical protein
MLLKFIQSQVMNCLKNMNFQNYLQVFDRRMGSRAFQAVETFERHHLGVDKNIVVENASAAVEHHRAGVKIFKGTLCVGHHNILLNLFAHDTLCRVQQQPHPQCAHIAQHTMSTGSNGPVMSAFTTQSALVSVFIVVRHICRSAITTIFRGIFVVSNPFLSKISICVLRPDTFRNVPESIWSKILR